MVNGLVKNYVERIKSDWSELLAQHGYTHLEEDLTSDGQWHRDERGDPSRDFGSVAFWNPHQGGVIVNEVKFYGEDGHTVHGTGVSLVKGAYDYFMKELGFERYDRYQRKIMPLKESFLEKIGLKAKKMPPQSAHQRNTKINGRDLKSWDVNSVDFYDFLNGIKA